MPLPPGSLDGLTVLVTRPAAEAEEAVRLVEEAGGRALCAPCLVLAPPPDPGALVRALGEGPEFVVCTSVNAARALAAAAPDLGAALSGAFVAAVGPRTAAALRAAGARVDLEAAEPSAAGLFAALRAARPDLRGRLVLFPRAAEGREELGELLAEAGAALRGVCAYQMRPAPPEDLAAAVEGLRAGAVDLVPLTSPRTAGVLVGALGEDGPALLARCAVGAIGETTACALREAGVRVDAVADRAGFGGLLLALAAVRRGG